MSGSFGPLLPGVALFLRSESCQPPHFHFRRDSHSVSFLYKWTVHTLHFDLGTCIFGQSIRKIRKRRNRTLKCPFLKWLNNWGWESY